ncbi:MAG: SPOR domain-containing protein [Muribaculaceae bacterium]|nr:SPOR domain-containing protein [Muribaculaceae bacterium]
MTRLTVVSAAMLQLSFIASAENSVNVIERIEKNSKGEISIEIPQNILNMILKQSSKKDANSGLKSGVNKLSGFRIQVFSDGRNQSTLEARAKARGSAILAKLPKYRGQVYTYSSSPNWYTRVGNFRTNAEANAALTEMKRAFPNFASEMRIVKCQIVVIK